MKYSECEKMAEVKDKSQVIGEFLEWLQYFKEMTICKLVEGEGEMEYSPIYLNTEELLAEFFNIDLKKVEKERCQMLAELRKGKR